MMGCVHYHEEVTLAHAHTKRIHPKGGMIPDLCTVKDNEIEVAILSQILQSQHRGLSTSKEGLQNLSHVMVNKYLSYYLA